MKKRLLPILVLFAASLGAAQPNIILVLIDDMAWSGTSVQIDPDVPESKGHYVKTPELEKLAAAGMRFTQAYAPGSMCSPSRAGILTGRTPAEVRMTTPGPGRTENYHKLSSGQKDGSLSTEYETIAKSLKSAGYATAHFGKWHLGSTGLEEYGYDVHDGNTANQVPNSSAENPKDIFGINERAFAFMEAQSLAGKPFYVQLSHYAVHTPIEARPSSLALFEDIPSSGRSDPAGLAAMTYDVDESIGQLRAKIETLGIAGNTYLIVMSDNGGGGGGPRQQSSGALNAGKGSLFEGGIRIPFFVEGPDIPGASISHQSITGCDLFPTFCEWAGTAIPKDLAGSSLASLLIGEIERLEPRVLLFHNPHYGRGPQQKPESALIYGDHKLIYNWEAQSYQLFNLAEDLGEKENLVEHNPETSGAMLALLKQSLEAVDASLPTTNPNYDPTAEVPSGRKTR